MTYVFQTHVRSLLKKYIFDKFDRLNDGSPSVFVLSGSEAAAYYFRKMNLDSPMIHALYMYKDKTSLNLSTSDVYNLATRLYDAMVTMANGLNFNPVSKAITVAQLVTDIVNEEVDDYNQQVAAAAAAAAAGSAAASSSAAAAAGSSADPMKPHEFGYRIRGFSLHNEIARHGYIDLHVDFDRSSVDANGFETVTAEHFNLLRVTMLHPDNRAWYREDHLAIPESMDEIDIWLQDSTYSSITTFMYPKEVEIQLPDGQGQHEIYSHIYVPPLGFVVHEIVTRLNNARSTVLLLLEKLASEGFVQRADILRVPKNSPLWQEMVAHHRTVAEALPMLREEHNTHIHEARTYLVNYENIIDALNEMTENSPVTRCRAFKGLVAKCKANPNA